MQNERDAAAERAARTRLECDAQVCVCLCMREFRWIGRDWLGRWVGCERYTESGRQRANASGRRSVTRRLNGPRAHETGVRCTGVGDGWDGEVDGGQVDR